MADSIIEQITDNLQAALNAVATYGGSTTCQRERINGPQINDRYPFVELAGPFGEIETQTDRAALHTLTYIAKYHIAANDEDLADDTEITYLTRNVEADLIKAVMADRTRNKLAQKTEATDYEYGFETDGEALMFAKYIVFEVRAKISATDPYLVA
jgi:hypothetical protein